MNAQHSSLSAEYGTPELYVAAGREVVGGAYDFDPCTSAAINDRYVRAARIWTKDDDGLADTAVWRGRGIVNPPGSCDVLERPLRGGVVNRYRSECDPLCKRPVVYRLDELDGKKPRTPPCTCRLVRRNWIKLVTLYRSGDVTAALWVGYSLEQQVSLQGHGVEAPLDFPTCVPGRRVAYLDPANDMEAAKQPTHGSFFTYLGPRPGTFRAMFGQFGSVTG